MEYQVGGAVPSQSDSYIERQADAELFEALLAGEFCYVLNSRQMGKSTLRSRTNQSLKAAGLACAEVDLQDVGKSAVGPKAWYAGVVQCLISELELSIKLRDWWRDHRQLGPAQRLNQFIRQEVLTVTDRPVVIFVDEIDSILGLPFSLDDFLALIRSFHSLTKQPGRITFALFGVGTPNSLIRDKSSTPFNIGRPIPLEGFSFAEARPLALGLAERAARPEVLLQEILDWTGGQPFLTQKLCRLAQWQTGERASAGQEADWVEQLVQQQIVTNWEFQDEPVHLGTIRDRLLQQDERQRGRLLGIYQTILQQGSVPAEVDQDQAELRLSGLVVARQGRLVAFNPIYRQVFNQAWVNQELMKLRDPFYAEAFAAWMQSHKQDESRLLRGEALQRALEWKLGRRLSDDDEEFLDASQQNELETERRAAQILEKAHRKAQKRVRIGSIVLAMAMAVAVLSGVFAQLQIWAANGARQELNSTQQALVKMQDDLVQYQIALQFFTLKPGCHNQHTR